MNVQHKKETEWMYFAGEDLRSAELLFKEGIYSQACFHAQQCAEKTLKAYIISRKTYFQKIHDLNELLGICISCGGDILKKYEEDMGMLNLFYSPMRYPDGIPGSLADKLPGKEDATQAIAAAENLYACVMKIFD